MDWPQIVGVIFGALVIYLALALRWVEKPFHWVVETNFPGGMHPYVWEPGLRILWLPIKPIMFIRNRIDMAQKAVTLHIGEKEGLGRKDPIEFQNAAASALVQLIYQVTDPIAATYNVQDDDLDIRMADETGQETLTHFYGYERATINRVEAVMRSFFGSMQFEEANEDSKRSEMEVRILNEVNTFISDNKWGVKVLLVDIIDFGLDEKTAAARSSRLLADINKEVTIKNAEAAKQAAVLSAQGQKEATITVAQGEQEAARLAGLGEQDRIKAVHGAGLEPAQAAAYVIAREANQAIAKGNATIIATSEGGNMNFAATVAGIVKGMGSGGGNQNASSPPAPATPTPPATTPAPQTPQSPRRRSNNP